jgi:hypothetical protein
VRAVGGADGLALLGLVAGQVGQRGLPRRDDAAVGAGRGGDVVDDGLGDRAGVERVGAVLRDGGQRLGIGRQGEGRAQRLGREVGVEVGGDGVGVAQEVVARAFDGRGHATADREAFGGELDAGLEQVLPRQRAVLLVRQLEHAHGAGRADGAPAAAGRGLGHGLVGGVVDPAQVVLGGRGRCGLAPVVGHHGLGGRVVVQHEGAAAEAAGLRLHQPQHGLHGLRRIHRAAARLQDLAACLAGERIGRGDHVVARVDRLLADAVAGRRLGRRRVARQAGADDHRAGVGTGLAGGVDRVVAVTAAAGCQQRSQHQR